MKRKLFALIAISVFATLAQAEDVKAKKQQQQQPPPGVQAGGYDNRAFGMEWINKSAEVINKNNIQELSPQGCSDPGIVDVKGRPIQLPTGNPAKK